MFLKRLFYASATVLLLTIAYHLGASTATAQAPTPSGLAGTISAAGLFFNNGQSATAVIGRTFYLNGSPLPNGATIPGTDPVIATGFGANWRLMVMLANGDTYIADGDASGPWTYAGNAVGGATAAHMQSFGALKAKYR